MFVGIGRVVLRIPGARSLKDRRRVVSSYKDRLKARLSVSVAEVGEVENHQMASVGIALVARDAGEAAQLLDRALGAAEQLSGALVIDSSKRVLPWQLGWSGALEDPLAGFRPGEDEEPFAEEDETFRDDDPSKSQ